MNTNTPNAQPPDLLTGLRVLDLSQFIPGPYATRTLADLGASVIKIEPPIGDPLRHLHEPDGGICPVYDLVNRGKQICALDLKTEPGKATLKNWLQNADVLLESFRPGVMQRLGFDWQACQQQKPELIYCSLSGYGQTGPYRARPGHDINYCAAAGLLARPPQWKNKPTPQSGNPPEFAFPPLADHTSAMLAAHAILAALYARQRSGRGRQIDVSIYESMLAFQYMNAPIAQRADFPLNQFLGGAAACYNLYRTQDEQFLSLGAVEPKFWANFCQTIGRPEWVARQFDPMPQCNLIREVQALLATRPLAEWHALLNPGDCCYEPLPEAGACWQHPQTRSRALADGSNTAYPAWISGRPAAPPPAWAQITPAEVNW